VRRLLLFALCAAAWAPATRGEGLTFLGRSADTWTRELSDGRPAVRRSAAFALGRIGGEALTATPELENCLRDPDPGVRAMSAEALGDIVSALRGGGQTVWASAGPSLRKALTSDEDPRVRRAAAYALGTFGERAAGEMAALRAALHDPDAGVRRSAARSTGRLGEAAGEAVHDLCDLLKDPDVLVRRDAITALGTLGAPAARPAVRALLTLAKGESQGVVRRAALDKLVGLVSAADRAGAATLYPLLRGDDPEAARSAAFVLANMGGPDAAPAVPLLQKLLRGEDDQLRALAAAALGSLGPVAAPAVLDLAKTLTEARNATVRRNAALALAHVGPKARDALPLLTRALDPSELREVRMFVGEAIMRIGSPDNDGAVPALLKVVESDPDPDVRHHFAWCVAQRPDIESNGISKVFLKVIEETDTETLALRYEAACHLAAHLRAQAPDRAVDIVYELFRDPRLTGYTGTDVRVSAAGAEAGAGRAQVKAVRPDGASGSRVVGAKALGWLGRKANRPEIVRALRDALKEGDPALQKAASEALQRIAP
jgi:HEAT repeat protein